MMNTYFYLTVCFCIRISPLTSLGYISELIVLILVYLNCVGMGIHIDYFGEKVGEVDFNWENPVSSAGTKTYCLSLMLFCSMDLFL